MLSLYVVFLVWVVGFGAFSLLSKEKVCAAVGRLNLSKPVSFAIIAVPLILVEEYLTAEGPYLSTIAITIPAFLFFFLILYAIIRAFKLRYRGAAAVYGVLGWINEFLIVGRLRTLSSSISVLLLMSILAFLIYAVLALLPTYYITDWNEQVERPHNEHNLD